MKGGKSAAASDRLPLCKQKTACCRLQAENKSLRAEKETLAAANAALQDKQQAAESAAAQLAKEKEEFQQAKASPITQIAAHGYQ